MQIIKLSNALLQHKIPFAIVGGHAVALHGAVRGTVDIDIILKWTLKNLQKIEIVLKEIGLESRLPVDAKTIFVMRKEYIENRNMVAWNFYNPINPIDQVDIIISHELDSKDIKWVQTAHGRIPILNKQKLIEMKKQSGRPQDLADIKALELIV